LEDLDSALASDSSSIDRKREALRVEYDYLAYTGESVPFTVTDKMLTMLMDQPCSVSRKNLWNLFYRAEEQEASKRELQRRRAKHRMNNIEKITRDRLKDRFDGVLYDHRGVSVAGPPPVIIPSTGPSQVVKRQSLNMQYALNFGQNLLLDLSSSTNCTNVKSVRDLHRQINGLYSVNRMHHEPFNIHLSNFHRDSLAHAGLIDSSPSRDYLWNVSPDSLSTLFPSDRILYLCPHAKHVWTRYNHEDVIVMGAYGKGEKWVQSAVMKKYQVRTARLNTAPFFVNRTTPSFDLTQMMQIILDARDTDGDWLYAFRDLGGRRSPVEWKPKYHFMKSRIEEMEKEEEENRSPEELLTKFKDRVYVNQRAIFKTRAELT